MIPPETIELDTKERHNAHVVDCFTPYINPNAEPMSHYSTRQVELLLRSNQLI